MSESTRKDPLKGVVPPQLAAMYLTAREYWSPLANGDAGAVRASTVSSKIDFESLSSRPAFAYHMLVYCEKAALKWRRDDPESSGHVTHEFMEQLRLILKLLPYKDEAKRTAIKKTEVNARMKDMRGKRWGKPPTDAEFETAYNQLNQRTWSRADTFWKALRDEFPEWTGKFKPSSNSPSTITLGAIRKRATDLNLKRKR